MSICFLYLTQVYKFLLFIYNYYYYLYPFNMHVEWAMMSTVILTCVIPNDSLVVSGTYCEIDTVFLRHA